MNKKVLRERMRRKRRQMLIRRCIKLGVYVAAVLLAGVFIIKGIILPIANRGKNNTGETTEETLDLDGLTDLTGSGDGGGESAESTETDETTVAEGTTTETASTGTTYEAVRVPVMGQNDLDKIGYLTPGWHENASGRWYQNADGTYYANGFRKIDGAQYSFDANGYIQTGWVTIGVNDYYFDESGVYDSSKTKPLLCLTFDDGPGQYTEELLDCLEENNAKATFMMLGQNVEIYPDTVKRMLDLGCEIGNHSWDHPQLTNLDMDSVVKQYNDTDQALINACGQASTVARAPYGAGNSDIYATVGKPFAMWSLDSLDWSYMDVDMDYDAVMNGDLTDGSVILMHDIHQPSVEAAKRIIPDLIERGYKLVTFSEMAAAKNVTLQNSLYIDFWQSSLNAGNVPGYTPVENALDALTSGSAASNSEESSSEESSEESYSDEADDGDYSEEG